MRKFIEWLRKIFGSPSPPPPVVTFDPVTAGYKLKFKESFNRYLDWSRWTWEYPGGQDQKGKVIWKQECVQIKDDGVHLIAKIGVPGVSNYCGQLCTWRFLETLFGFIRFRAKVPPGGFLYFWALWGYNKNGWQPEIDICEGVGSTSKDAGFALHTVKPDGTDRCDGYTWQSPIDLSNAFHDYAVLWTSTKISWFIDGIERYSTTNYIPQTPIFWVVGMQSGGPEGGFNHLFTPSESGKEMIVESFEVWQQ